MRQELFYVAAGQVLSFLGSFAAVKGLTSVLGTASYGELAVAVTISSTINQFVYFPLNQSILRFSPVAKASGTSGAFETVVRRIHFFAAAILIPSSVLVAFSIAHLVAPRWGRLIVLAVIYATINGANSSFSSHQSSRRNRKIVAFNQTLEVWLRFGFALLLVSSFSNTSWAALAGYIFAICTTLYLSLLLTRNRLPGLSHTMETVPDNKETKILSDILRHGYPYVILAAFSSVSMFADRWVLQYLANESDVGIYVAMSQIATAPQMLFIGVITLYAFPIIIEAASDLDNPEMLRRSVALVRKTIFAIGCIAIPMVLSAFEFGGQVIRALTSSEFSHGGQFLWILVASCLVFQMGQAASMVGQVYKVPDKFISAFALNALSTVTFSVLLGTKYGIEGIAVGAFLSNLVYFVSTSAIACQIVRRHRALSPKSTM